MKCLKSDIESIEKCVSVLKSNGIVILPTDTVYGFSGIVKKDSGTDVKIREIKGRSEDKPFIQLISDPDDIYKYTNQKIPKSLLKNWPGPLTIIAKNLDGKTTTAYRCPGDEWLRKIIRNCGFPLYSTSVNKSGYPILETEDEIVKIFESEVDLIVLDGDRKKSLPSTIVMLEDDNYKVLRQGAVEV